MGDLRAAREVAYEAVQAGRDPGNGTTITIQFGHMHDCVRAALVADRLAIVEWLRAELKAQGQAWRDAEAAESEPQTSEIYAVRAGCHCGLRVALSKLDALESAIKRAGGGT